LSSQKQKDLTTFRKKYILELEKNVEVWKEIRDDKEQSGRDRIEAAKNIAKVLGAFAIGGSDEKEKDKSVFSKEEKDSIAKDVKSVLESLNSGSD